MGSLVQLDAAARACGKSEVTMRRLIKSGKVTATKKKTPTGFIYLLDLDEVAAYYSERETAIAAGDGGAAAPKPLKQAYAEPAAATEPLRPAAEGVPAKHAHSSQGKVRVAVSAESGDPSEYWLKRAEAYEERYGRELHRVSELREEMGVWRGRAEHAQGMLMKLLPAPESVGIGASVAEESAVRNTGPTGWMTPLALSLATVFAAAAAGLLYLLVRR